MNSGKGRLRDWGYPSAIVSHTDVRQLGQSLPRTLWRSLLLRSRTNEPALHSRIAAGGLQEICRSHIQKGEHGLQLCLCIASKTLYPLKIWDETTAVNAEGKKRTFVKDVSDLQPQILRQPSKLTMRLSGTLQMAQYIIPPTNAATSTPTLPDFEKDGNPTVIPSDILLHPDIHHAFLIRTPAKAVPSECSAFYLVSFDKAKCFVPGYYRLCGPPKAAITGFDYFDPAEVGLRESK